METKRLDIETHLILSRWAKTTIVTETEYTVEQLQDMADFYYENDNLSAPVASGSVKWDGMIVAPCSMKTLACIASGYTEGLVARAADVAIKERRRLVLLTRECPLNPIHLENMLNLTRLGVTIMPPVPAFYTRPETVEDIVNQTVGRTLDQFGLEIDILKRWGGGYYGR